MTKTDLKLRRRLTFMRSQRGPLRLEFLLAISFLLVASGSAAGVCIACHCAATGPPTLNPSKSLKAGTALEFPSCVGGGVGLKGLR